MSLRWIRCFLTLGVAALSAQLCFGGGSLYVVDPCGLPDTSGNTYTSPTALSLTGTVGTVDCSAYLSFGDIGVSLVGGSGTMIGIAEDSVAVTGLNSDTLQFEWAVDGTFALDPIDNAASDAFYYTVGHTDGNANIVASVDQSLAGGSAEAVNGTYSLTDVGDDAWTFSATGVADLPIINGYVDLTQTMYIDSDFGGLDFLHTGLVGGAVVLDSSGNVVSDATITSDSGFDYTQQIASSPEPATFWMIAAGLAAFALGLRKRHSA